MGDDNPFFIADAFPPDWAGRGELPALAWPDIPVPRRTVSQVQQVLKNGDSATLLGTATLSNGEHRFQVVLTDVAGNQTARLERPSEAIRVGVVRIERETRQGG